jgi:hypothetical protein
MLAWSFVRTVALGVAGAALAVASVSACVVQSEPGSGYSGDGSGGSSGGGTGTGSSSGGASAQPMLVDVDPDQTMNAAPGEGVGVFIQYKTGGHWNIWWTCDTNKTGLGCSFDNTVTVSTGSIANLAGQALETSDSVTQPSTQKVEAVTSTTTGVDGITFDTPFSSGQTPVITLDAKLNGAENGQYLFFVQDGKINGDYQGMLTDPLMLEPKTP